jgi:large subunit ribosomal protein L20
MARVKGGPKGHLRHKRILKLSKGTIGSRHTLIRRANETMLKGLWYATRDRRVRRRDLRKLWIVRINAAARINGITYSRLIAGMKTTGIIINRKMLADLAVRDPKVFAEVVLKAKNA